MTSLTELVQMAKSALIGPGDLIDVLEELVSAGRDFGFLDAKQVIELFDRCSPAMTKADLIRVRDACRNGSKALQGTGRANAANDFARVADAAEAKAKRMP